MTDTAMTTAVRDPAEPDGAPRLAVLDILRGIAILGVLFMNINDMGRAFAAGFTNDPRLLGWTAADQVAWWLREVLATGTARCLLEMLFGVGMVILTDRAATRMGEWHVLRAYAFRNIVLFLFGLVHVFVLLWFGDILHTYGIAALVAVLFRRAKPRLMLTIGLIGATMQLLVGSGFVIYFNGQRAADVALEARAHAGATLSAPEKKQLADYRKSRAERDKGRAETRAMIAKENKDRSGTAATWTRSMWGAFIFIERQLFEGLAVWEAAGTMLVGAALYRWGIIQGERSRRFYLAMTALAYLVGMGLRVWEASVVTRFDHTNSVAFAAGEYARLATTLGHLGLANLLLATAAGRRLLRPFEAAGRTALSIYVAQTVLCLWALYPPWGFALYGRQGWAALMLTAVAVDAALLLVANWWVTEFRMAPVEWAWRSILAGQRLPFRRGRPAAVLGTPVTA